MTEIKGFVIAIVFIITFSGLLVATPTDLQGQGETPDIVTPIDPNIVASFSDSEDWHMTDLTAYDQYAYTLLPRDWLFSYYAGTIQLGAKILIGGIIWLGQLDSCEFYNASNINRGYVLSTTELDIDAVNGTVRYDLRYLIDGSDAGAFIIYWNTTEYSDSADAFLADDVYFMHGVGITNTAGADIGSLLLGLLLLQLPNCPPLINLLLATPLYACVVFLIWFIIKETMPFV